MKYQLQPHLRYCLPAGEAIFVDLKSGRYFRLPPSIDRQFQALRDSDWSDDDGTKDIQSLLRLGILMSNPNDIQPRCGAPPGADRELLRHTGHLSWRMRARAMCAPIGAKRLIANKTLSEISDVFDRKRAKICRFDPASSEPAVSAIAAAFLWTCFWRAPKDRCLENSLGFALVALGEGHKVHVIVGVSDRPFAAHAWVQQGTMVLNDTLDRVSLYSPILAL